MTAAELAAQAREEQSAQRARRDEDMEAEKEEAARALEDEFEEMEGLDERVKKLREQREALRSQSAQFPAPPEQQQFHNKQTRRRASLARTRTGTTGDFVPHELLVDGAMICL